MLLGQKLVDSYNLKGNSASSGLALDTDRSAQLPHARIGDVKRASIGLIWCERAHRLPPHTYVEALSRTGPVEPVHFGATEYQ